MVKKRLKKKVRITFNLVILIVIIVSVSALYNQRAGDNNEEVSDTDSVGVVSQDDTFNRLKSLEKNNPKIKTILNDYKSYPSDLLETLSKNIEMLDYVLDFNNKKGQVLSDNVGTIKVKEIPLFIQWDKRWGYAKYGDNYLGINGCAPTALAMVIVGLTQNESITPYVVSNYAKDAGYYINGVGTSWNLMTDGSKHFGVIGTNISLDKATIYNYLENGNPIICSMRAGDFTSTGHFIVLAGIKNGKIKVNDSNSIERSNKLWDFETLKYQIKNLWVFERR